MSNIIPLFSTPIYYSKINNLDIKEIESQILLSNFEVENISKKDSNYAFWISKEKNLIDKLPNLKQNIIKHVNYYLFEALSYNPFDYYFSDSWITRCNLNSKTENHNHRNSLYSGIVYIDVPNEGGEIVFKSPENNSMRNTVQYIMDYRENNIFNSSQWFFRPMRGDILLFPSYTYHEVINNESVNDRYSFAFNILPDNYRFDKPGARVL